MRFLKKIFMLCLFSGLGLFTVGTIINVYMISFSKPYIYNSISELPEKYVVIIPGAKVYENNVSFVVRDRIDVGLNVVKEGKADKILVSGDHGRKKYDEVNEMKAFMLKNYSIDKNIVFLDHAGFSTYETMYRARDVFCVESCVIVTQRFHCARAVYIGRKLGMDVVALEAPAITPYRKHIKINWEVREFLARIKNFFLVIFKAKPTYLGDIIPITGDPKLTWDKE
ncbi:MAG: YdcF family protein [Treponema sp.]|nr:YdcF family protein [Treponema sp.]